ncbi:MAG: hypothetical protein R3301_05865 [Saprospiraceae bacterium]|nr:hypothetical protein [Saprospiraceae bacterium]
MKQIFMLLVAVSVSGICVAQDAGKDLKKATRNVANYNLDPSSNEDKLMEAIDLINGVVKDPEFQKSSKAWLTYGKAYSELINKDVQALVLNPEHEIQYADACNKVWTGFKNAYNYAEKNYEQKDALSGLKDILNNISYISNTILRAGKYEQAYHAYMAVIEGDAFLVKEGEESSYPSQKDLQDQVYLAAIAALSAEMWDEADALFNRLYKEGYDDPAVFEGLFKVRNAKGDAAGASTILKEGRKKYPDDKGLLFAMINESLQKGDSETALANLKIAMAEEPNNISVPTTLGNVYDQLYAEALEAGNKELAHQHYENAKTYFSKALEIDDNHFDAVYMMGALEYNRAAELANEVNALADDYSKEGTAKYEAKKAEMLKQFELALPYFVKAEKLNPKDMNTLIALREIYARKDQFEMSNQYKEKIEQLSGGN